MKIEVDVSFVLLSFPSVVLGEAPPQAKREMCFSISLVCLTQCAVNANHSSGKGYKCCNGGPQ